MHLQSGLLLIFVHYKRKDADSARSVYNSIAGSPVVKSLINSGANGSENINKRQLLLGTFKKLVDSL